VTGSSFGSSSSVQWNGSALATTYVSTTQLTAQLPASDLTAAGTQNVTVSAPGAAQSNAASFTIASADATSYRMNPAHTDALSMNCTIGLPVKLWNAPIPGYPTTVLIGNGMVYTTYQTGNYANLIALNQSNGSVAWGPVVLSSQAYIAYDNGQIFAVTANNAGIENGTMIAYDATTGKQNWSSPLTGQSEFDSGVTALNGLVYSAGSGSNATVYALNEKTGVLAWTASVEGGDDSIPTVTASGLYLRYPCQAYDLSPTTGQEIWYDNSGCVGGGGATPFVANDILYAPALPGDPGGVDNLTFNATTGAKIGSYSSSGFGSIDSNNSYFILNGTLNAVSLSTGKMLWSFTQFDGIGSPVTVNQYTYVPGNNGTLYVLDNATGNTVASFANAVIGNNLSAGDGLLITGANNASLTAYSLTSGN